MVLNQPCHETQLFNTFTQIITWLNMNVTLMVIISLVSVASHLNLECSYLHVSCRSIYIQYNGKAIEKKISFIYQNINENDCQSHLFAALHKNDSNCMASCRMCTCGCLSVLYFLYVIVLIEILNSNMVGLNQLTFVMTLLTYQKDKILKYKILAICLENFTQNIINGLDVSLLSRKFDRIVLFASCASIILSFVSYALECAQIYLNYEMRLFFTNYSTLLINSIKKIPQRKICRMSRLDVKFKRKKQNIKFTFVKLSLNSRDVINICYMLFKKNH